MLLFFLITKMYNLYLIIHIYIVTSRGPMHSMLSNSRQVVPLIVTQHTLVLALLNNRWICGLVPEPA